MRNESPQHLKRGKKKPWDPAGILLEDSIASGPVDFGTVFGNARPVEIEIGTGKGTFLLARASARPECNFLGIEYARSYCIYSADRLRRAGLTNARMLCTDAATFFKIGLGDESVWRVHIYFPDPWPKKKHNRRRLIQPPFLLEVRRVLKPGGQLLIVTDHRDYFDQIRKALGSVEGFAHIPFPQMTDETGEVVGTNFERKYIAQGRPFFKTARMRCT